MLVLSRLWVLHKFSALFCVKMPVSRPKCCCSLCVYQGCVKGTFLKVTYLKNQIKTLAGVGGAFDFSNLVKVQQQCSLISGFDSACGLARLAWGSVSQCFSPVQSGRAWTNGKLKPQVIRKDSSVCVIPNLVKDFLVVCKGQKSQDGSGGSGWRIGPAGSLSQKVQVLSPGKKPKSFLRDAWN